MLTFHCPGLTSCLDLDYWAGVSSEELQTLGRQLRLNNVKLALSEEGSLKGGLKTKRRKCHVFSKRNFQPHRVE